jgi:hypothetical protein
MFSLEPKREVASLLIKVQREYVAQLLDILIVMLYGFFQFQLMVNGESGDIGLALLHVAPE